MRTVGNPDPARDPDTADVLRAAREELAARPPRTCLWPACAEPARPADGTDERAGGRPSEFCSPAHQRKNAAEVRRLLSARGELVAARTTALVQQQREIDAVLAEIDRCLATHGAVAPSPDTTAQAPRRAGRPADPGAAHPGLRLREGQDPEDFADDWESLRDAHDGVRPLLGRITAARSDTSRRALVADAADQFVQLAQVVDVVVVSVTRVR